MEGWGKVCIFVGLRDVPSAASDLFSHTVRNANPQDGSSFYDLRLIIAQEDVPDLPRTLKAGAQCSLLARTETIGWTHAVSGDFEQLGRKLGRLAPSSPDNQSQKEAAPS